MGTLTQQGDAGLDDSETFGAFGHLFDVFRVPGLIWARGFERVEGLLGITGV